MVYSHDCRLGGKITSAHVFCLFQLFWCSLVSAAYFSMMVFRVTAGNDSGDFRALCPGVCEVLTYAVEEAAPDYYVWLLRFDDVGA